MKKGFTLIELLAVIVILAIIALIATPLILGVIEKARIGAVSSSGYGYIDAVEKQAAINMLDTTKNNILDNIEYSVEDLTDLGVKVKGNAPDSGYVLLNKGQISECELIFDKYKVTCNGQEIVVEGATEEVKLPAGFYDENDELVMSWEEAVNRYSISNTYTYSYMLNEHSNITKVVLGDNIEQIYSGAFSNTKYIKEVVISNTINEIKGNAFDRSSIQKIVIPENVKKIGDGAFYASSLEEVIIKNGIETLGDTIFRDCVNLVSVKLPNTLTTISKNLFMGNTSLKSIIIPDSVTVIDQNAFYGCKSLTKIKLPSKLTTIGSSSFGFTGLTEIDIPDSVTRINSSAFISCTSLSKVTIGLGVDKMEGSIFSNTALTEVTFKNGNNWYYVMNSTDLENKTNGVAIDVSTSENAILNIKKYGPLSWYRS